MRLSLHHGLLVILAALSFRVETATVDCLATSGSCGKLPAASLLVSAAAAGSGPLDRAAPDGSLVQPHKASSEVSGQPSQLRFFLYITDSWSAEREDAVSARKRAGPDPHPHSWVELFEPVSFFKSQFNPHAGEGLSVVAIEFAPNGLVMTPNNSGKPLKVITDEAVVSLVEDKRDAQARLKLAEWFTPTHGGALPWAPALCGEGELPSSPAGSTRDYLYSPDLDVERAPSLFGCREWGHQLYDPTRPYVDVTSYLPLPACPEGEVETVEDEAPQQYVGPTIGWIGLTDIRKPVIGWYEYAWFCLFNCPEPEVPGLIADIGAWAERRGWTAPERPQRGPMFPDPRPGVGDEDDPLGEGAANDDPADTPEDKE